MVTWFLYSLLMAWINYALIKRNKKPIHWLNALVTCIVAGIFAYMDFRPWYFTFFGALIIYWFTFDTILNLLRGGNAWYLGKESIMDNLTKKSGIPLQVVWIFKGLAAIFFFLAYYLNY